jgi:hypothetical protein
MDQALRSGPRRKSAMEPLAIPCFALASVSWCVGAFSLLLYLRTRTVKEHLPFSLLCFNLGAFDLICVGLYNAQSLADGVFWQRLQLVSLTPVGVLTLWFYALLIGRRLDRVIGPLCVVFAILALGMLALDAPGITPSVSTPAIKEIQFGGQKLITYYESEIGFLGALGIALSWAIFVYVFGGLYLLYRRGASRHLTAILLGLSAYFAGLINDSLVAGRIYSFLYVSEYAFLLVIAAMAYALLVRFADLHLSIEQLNRGLEQRVQEALADVKVLRGLIPICAGCKSVRNDQGYWSRIETYLSDHSDATFTHGMCPKCMDEYYPNRRKHDTAEPAK